jgi:hypothetical protein
MWDRASAGLQGSPVENFAGELSVGAVRSKLYRSKSSGTSVMD